MYLLDISRGEPHWKLILPLENHLWHKPSEVMFFRSLHLPLSQFWAPVYVLWHCYQSQHRFVSSRLRNSQTGARWDGADITPSKFKSKTWQKLMKPRWFTVGTQREEQTSRMFCQVAFSLFTTSCSCHIEAVSSWPPPIHSSLALLSACLMKAVWRVALSVVAPTSSIAFACLSHIQGGYSVWSTASINSTVHVR